MESSRTRAFQTLSMSYDRNNNSSSESIWIFRVSVGAEVALSTAYLSLLQVYILLGDVLSDQKTGSKAVGRALLGAQCAFAACFFKVGLSA
jgi:hypothetical protein